MDWKAAFRQNWPYKVAALVLALLLWFNVSADEDRTEQPVSTRLEFDFRDERWVAVDVPEEVRTIFRGRLRDIFELPASRPVIRRTIESVEDSVVRVELDPGMVQFDRRLSVQAVSVRPSEVQLRFEPVEEKRVPVTIDLTAAAAPGFTVVGNPIVQPESVTVRGARSQVAAISHLATEPVTLRDLREPTTRQLPLERPEGLERLAVEPAQVLATLRVDTLVERRLRVRVRAVGEGAEGVSLSPADVEVRLRGPRGVLAAVTPEDVTATVELLRAPAGRERLPVTVYLAPGVWATAEPVPPLVLVSPAERSR